MLTIQSIMDNINLPQELFDLIINQIKTQKYNITTMRHLARTCQELNLILHEYILIKQIEYLEPYETLGCYVLMASKSAFINELVLDFGSSFKVINNSAIYNLTFDFNNYKVKDDYVICCSAAISCNVKLIETIFKLHNTIMTSSVAKCIGHSCDHNMFRFIWRLELTYGFWFDCLKGALLGDNVKFFEYCYMYDLMEIIDEKAHKLKTAKGQCRKWLRVHGYL